MEPFIRPENRQNYFLSLCTGIEEAIDVFPWRDFTLLYKGTKIYVPDVWMDLCRSRIVTALEIVNKSLFLFYGKRFLFYRDFLSNFGTCIFRDKRCSKYIERYFKTQEWDFGISAKKSCGREELQQIGNKGYPLKDWLLQVLFLDRFAESRLSEVLLLGRFTESRLSEVLLLGRFAESGLSQTLLLGRFMEDWMSIIPCLLFSFIM